MSDFLLLVPADWTQLDWDFLTNNVPNFSSSNVMAWINGGQIDNDIGALLRDFGTVPQTAQIHEAKLIDNTYFLVKIS